MNATFATYLVYLVVSVVLTIWVARTLSAHGITFLKDVFRGHEALASSVNHLLVVGFYLMNLGYAALIMKANGGNTILEATEVLAWKLGALLISLGMMHFFNMYLFFRIRRRSQLAVLPPPVAPQMRLPMPSVSNPAWGPAYAPQPAHAPVSP